MSFQGLIREINDTFRQYGVSLQEQHLPGKLVMSLHVPTVSGERVLATVEPMPSDAVGAMVGAKHKLRSKLKAGVKKLAKSKLLKGLTALALPELAATMSAVKVAKKLAQHAKKAKSPAHHAAVHSAALRVTNALRRTKGKAPVAQSYQSPSAPGMSAESPEQAHEEFDQGGAGPNPSADDVATLRNADATDDETPESADADEGEAAPDDAEESPESDDE